jgi:hypothetical protein
MRNIRSLLVALLVAPGALTVTWIGTGSGHETAPLQPVEFFTWSSA